MRQAARLYLAVGAGAALGSLLRFAGSAAGLARASPAPASSTSLGSLVIGFFATISGPDGRLLIGPVPRQFVTSGVCGGFTTFSAMSLDAFLLLAADRPGAAALYLAAVIGLSLAAVWAGHALAARLNR